MSTAKLIQSALKGLKNPEKAAAQTKYMKSQFVFLGISTPDRRAATKPIWAKPTTDAVVSDLLKLGAREYLYEAVEYLGRRFSGTKVLSDDEIRAGWALIAQVADCDPWWDTIDFLASHATGRLLARAGNDEIRREILDACWANESEWFDRIAILHQMGYKSKMHHGLLERSIHIGLKRSPKSPWIPKAAATALRTYSDVGEKECAWVEAFVAQSRKLPLSAKKEALRNVEKNNAKFALKAAQEKEKAKEQKIKDKANADKRKRSDSNLKTKRRRK